MNRQARLSRQADLILDPGGFRIAVIGVGGIGSNAVHMALSMGYDSVTLFDPDEVGEENIYPGFFSMMHYGVDKVDAIADTMIGMYGDSINLQGHAIKFEDDPLNELFDIVIISTDTLESRQMMWERYSDMLCSGWWIDARMGGTLATVYSVNMASPLAYQDYTKELSEGEPGELPCGEKATAPLTKGFISGMIGQSLANIANGEDAPHMQRYDMGLGMMIKQDEPPRPKEN